MLTTRHPVDFSYTRPELEALFRYARDHNVERSGRYAAMPIGDGQFNAPILIVDTHTGQVTIKVLASVEGTPVPSKVKLATLAPWSE